MAFSAPNEGVIAEVEAAVTLTGPHAVRRRLVAGVGLALWAALVCLSCAEGPDVLTWSVVAASWGLLALIAARVLVRHAH
jgi:hypothetical protein